MTDEHTESRHPLIITALLFPEITQLDLTGPAEVFAQVPGVRMQYVWHMLDPVPTSSGLAMLPTVRFDDAAPADVVLVPGGQGAFDLLEDEIALTFLRQQAEHARWVTSVCTGAFALAQAGLLDGRRATTHWASRPLLRRYPGIRVTDDRVTVDGNRITAGGVTSGIDFALTLVARLCDEQTARDIALKLEYDPHPPFDAGTPATHSPEQVAAILAANERVRGPLVEQALQRIAAR
ncbi:DJ-1/PfpI family protein [Pseudoclavibacter sp. 13-3]|uniref:DJ-1/PfpI family protein n=1 Tax=Pseudoclavibacter sp. 13-3 TaxID=2901228 RepID=UPI001E49D794|nr:DJ-1/PfpI family protein [Pseudoclavibacter sp. 13-3]MCD7102372.1 DJ-1/PfpI family protein [Pseudoclavibacter sp. 13-3]